MPQTILEVFDATVGAHADRPAMLRKRGSAWEPVSWSGYRERVLRAARALVALGVRPGDGIVVLSANRPEWFITNLAGMTVGARVAGIYTNNTAEQCHYIAEHAEAKVAIVDRPQALARLSPSGARPASLSAVVLLEGDPPGPGVMSWADFLAKGDPVHDAEVARRRAALDGDVGDDLIYTSGTTGTPKAVMLTQRNLAFIAERIAGDLVPIGAGDHLISYLPLSHIAEQVVSHLLSIATGACRPLRGEPREAAREPARGAARTSSSACRASGRRSRRRSQARAPRRARSGAGSSPGRAGSACGRATPTRHGRARPWSYGLADRLVFSKVRERLGLDARACSSPSAGADREGDARLLPVPRPADHGGRTG